LLRERRGLIKITTLFAVMKRTDDASLLALGAKLVLQLNDFLKI
jgi:hypothetical protein